MKIITAFAVGLALVGALQTAPAQALNSRTFVSPTGSDSNDCSLATSCRTFQGALAQVAAGGEIAVLGTAGYNGGSTVTIDKAVSIVNPSAFEAGIRVQPGQTGIVINAGVSDAVSLRGLTIEGAGVGATGIQFNTGKSLTIENCVIRNMTGDGINFFPNATSKLTVSNTVVSDNGDTGIYVYPSSYSERRAMFNRVEANNNGYHGIFFNGSNSTGGTFKATVSDSVAAGNGHVGFYVNSNALSAAIILTVVRSVAAGNGTGVYVNGDYGVIQLASSTVTGNETNYAQLGVSKLYSYGDNNIDIYGVSVGGLSQAPKQ